MASRFFWSEGLLQNLTVMLQSVVALCHARRRRAEGCSVLPVAGALGFATSLPFDVHGASAHRIDVFLFCEVCGVQLRSVARRKGKSLAPGRSHLADHLLEEGLARAVASTWLLL